MSRAISLASYETHHRSAYPELWENCCAAWMPGLGPTGLKLQDYSGRNAWGLLENMSLATNWTTSQGRPALSFGGSASSDRVLMYSVVFKIYSVPACSISAWVNSTAFSAMAGVYARQGATSPFDGASLTIDNGYPTFRFNAGGTETVTTSSVLTTTGRWHHVVCRRNGSATSIFVDGVETVGTANTSWTTSTASPTSYIGNYYQRGDYFNGLLDDIRLYQRALSDDEVRLLGLGRCIAAEPRRVAVSFPFLTNALTTSGTAAATLQADTGSAAAVVRIAANGSPSLPDATAAAAGATASVAISFATTANDTGAVVGSLRLVAASSATASDATATATALTGGGGSVAVSLVDDSSMAFGLVVTTGTVQVTTLADTLSAFGQAGGYGGTLAVAIADSTLSAVAAMAFSASAAVTTEGDTSSAVSVPFQSPIEILWEDQPTILWETGDVVEWDLLWVIYTTVAGVAGPATATATGTHTPPPSAGGTIAATLGSAAVGANTSGLLKFLGAVTGAAAVGATSQATGSWSASDFVGKIVAQLGSDFSTASGVLKFVATITGSTNASGSILGPVIPIDGDGGGTTDGGQVFVHIEACTFIGDASAFEFVGKSPDYRFVGQACGSCA